MGMFTKLKSRLSLQADIDQSIDLHNLMYEMVESTKDIDGEHDLIAEAWYYGLFYEGWTLEQAVTDSYRQLIDRLELIDTTCKDDNCQQTIQMLIDAGLADCYHHLIN